MLRRINTYLFNLKQIKTTFCSPVLYFLAISFLLVQCKEENPKSGKEIDLSDNYETFQSFDLSPFDIKASIMLPDETANIGASTKPEVYHEEDGFKWDIQVGPNFKVHVEDWGANRGLVADKKSQNEDLGIYEIRYLIEEEDFIIYETKLKVEGLKNASKSVGVQHVSYHVFAEKVIDGITYEFRSPDEGYELVIIELMAKTICSVNGNK
jgi:hypothetical protein